MITLKPCVNILKEKLTKAHQQQGIIMNYRHHFHAGNFADVFKHILLTCLLTHMHKKNTPFTYIDSHAGRGLYFLNNSDTQKLKEYQFGIEALIHFEKENPAPQQILQYLAIVKKFYHDDKHMSYPGSPKIAELLMRPNDKMFLCELHPEEFALLEKNMPRKDKLTTFNHIDAYTAIKALTPPKHTTRGLLMIDPPFEKINEFSLIENSLKDSLRRWQQGNYMVWHPIKNKIEVAKFQNKLRSLANNSLFVDFFIKRKDISSNLIGCGVAMINPPWKLEEELRLNVLPYLAKALGGVFDLH